MEVKSGQFPKKARAALGDATLQRALGNLRTGFRDRRAETIARLPEYDALAEAGREIKTHVLDHLDIYLARFEAAVTAAGGQVHWCIDAEDARDVILDICRQAKARRVVKSKSMISEELALNDHLEAFGIEPVETDLGEYIIQLRDEPPSHITAPAIHLTKEDVSDTFVAHHGIYGKTRRLENPADLLAEAREILRQRFLEAEVGITGANFLVAESGSIVLVTNEGNADLAHTLPPVHIAVASIEKIVPTTADAWVLLRLLARNATGQEISVYTSFINGPRRAAEADGPAAFHVVLLDGGRSQLAAGGFRDVLRCIRCGACMNHCPVYGAVGGHAYGWVYPGPIGAVLTPALVGVASAGHLPNASSFCGRCAEVCPVGIPLPDLMRDWRRAAFAAGFASATSRAGLRLWGYLARRPRLYGALVWLAARGLRGLGPLLGPRLGVAAKVAAGVGSVLPGLRGWVRGRALPPAEGRSFQEVWRRRQGMSGRGHGD